ncbi:MAG: hypothetical protein PHV25_00925 [Candidatus Pacebacteria bacterium]|nr:hypothetical protein [Candidatus Paceibacterota bacterium]
MEINWAEILIQVNGLLVAAIPGLVIFWQLILAWWWLPLPFLLWKKFLYFWLWWRNDLWVAKQKTILLEIRIPKENPKPIRAMELVFTGLWQIWAEPNWIEKWWDGQCLLSYSFEIVAVDGVPHFYIRCSSSALGMIETHIYAQFPEAEVFEVEDYTKKVPQDMPNSKWDLWGTDFKLAKANCYPIKTFHDFETEREAKEEKRIDPISSLLEGMSFLKKGEQIWVQVRATPIFSEVPWLEEGKKIKNQLLSRKTPSKPQPLYQDIINALIGAEKKEEKKDDILPPEMRLTEVERETVAAIERKMDKVGFEVGIRYIYLSKKDVMVKSNLRLPMSYFTNFNTQHANAPIPDGKTIPKARKVWYDPFWFPERRLHLKKRIIFRRYVDRLPFFFPLSGGTFVLNAEELATIYHFPSKILTPASMVPRVEAKKGEAPLELPIEE